MLTRKYLAHLAGFTHPTVIHAYSWQDAYDQAKRHYGPALTSVTAAESIDDRYIAGLRRAQELAKRHAQSVTEEEVVSLIEWCHFDAAIDAEVAKEGK